MKKAMDDMLHRAQESRRIGVMALDKDGVPQSHYQLATTKEGLVIRLETWSGQTWTFMDAPGVVGGGYWQAIDEGKETIIDDG